MTDAQTAPVGEPHPEHIALLLGSGRTVPAQAERHLPPMWAARNQAAVVLVAAQMCPGSEWEVVAAGNQAEEPVEEPAGDGSGRFVVVLVGAEVGTAVEEGVETAAGPAVLA
jgi:hypothetical protein